MGKSSFVKVIIADNQPVYQAGMGKLLSLAGGFEIVALCTNGAQLFRAIEASRECVVIAASTLKVELSHLVFSLNQTRSRLIILAETFEHHLPYTAGGITGFLHRDASVEDLVDCVRRSAVRSNVGPFFHDWQMPKSEDQVGTNVRNRLSPKEINILSLVTKGWKNRAIGVRLETSEQVVKNCLRGMFDKAGVSDRLELALFTIHHRVLAEAACKASAALGIQAGPLYSRKHRSSRLLTRQTSVLNAH